MFCDEARDWLQRRLDGEPMGDCTALNAHLAQCLECREQFALADRLAAALPSRPRPVVPVDFADRVVARAVVERRRRLAGRMAVGVALAASVLVAVGLWRRPAVTPGGRPMGPEPGPSVQRQLEEAGQAVAALTRRTADETVGPTRGLLPDVPLPTAVPVATVAKNSPAEAEQSLRDVRRGVTSGLEPVTTSARRAVSMFFRELPGPKTGS
jgi:hypothetical protein